MKNLSACLVLVLLLYSFPVAAQIVVSTNNDGLKLSQILAGNGVRISNVVMNCPDGAAGTFNCANCNLGMKEGIVLTSGSVDSIPGPNASGNSGEDKLSIEGDSDLSELSQSYTYDACVLEFDMVTTADSVEFKYIFGSEEYLEYVYAGFNDVFGFFISGPGIPLQNIALVPGTNTPVSIDNVNSYDNSQYYIDNGTGDFPPNNASSYYIQYDGFTTLLKAKIGGLRPCNTYHLKLAVADAGDGVLDSGVFLEAQSLRSNSVTFDSVRTTAPGWYNAIEGCVDGIITFHLQIPVSEPVTVKYKIEGNAINGVDYSTIPDSIIIPAGDTLYHLHIAAVPDGNAEGSEKLILTLFDQCSSTVPYDSVVLLIEDELHLYIAADTDICAGGQVQLLASPSPNYAWSPALGLSAVNIANPMASPTVTSVYKCTTSVGGCSASDSVTVTVNTASFSVNAGADTGLYCKSVPVQLNAVVTGQPVAGKPFTYNWTPATGLSSSSVAAPLATPQTSTGYVVKVYSGGCWSADTVLVNIYFYPDTFQFASTPVTCPDNQSKDGEVSIVPASTLNQPYMYSLDGSQVQPAGSFQNLAQGQHRLHIVNNYGCATDTTITVTGPEAGLLAVTPADTSVNYGQQVQLTAVLSNYPAGAITSYVWLPADGLNCTGCATPMCSGQKTATYTLTVTYNGACTVEASVTVTTDGLPPVYIPNSFTPNNDFVNDEFTIYGQGIASLNLRIFDKWGQKVYDSMGSLRGWDGRYKGELLNPAVFVYIADITFVTDKSIVRKGSVTLLR